MTSAPDVLRAAPSPDVAPAPGGRRRRRRWTWVLVAVVAVLGCGALATWATTNRARPVTTQQAEQQYGQHSWGGATGARPAPGVYQYVGSGSEHLSLPPLSQAEGPPMPATVTLRGRSCWIFRIDYSTHHWETWNYCLHHGDLWEAGGQSWQLWSIGPLNVTNLSNFVCAPRSMAVPARRSPGQRWQSSCTGTNTSVKGKTVSAGPYIFVADVTMKVGGKSVPAARFLRLRTDSGAQHGTERSEVWFDLNNGLPLRFQQDIRVTSDTPFGTSTYTQTGIFTLTSLKPVH